eukprot:748632-Hanusia_phi.AAC.2
MSYYGARGLRIGDNIEEDLSVASPSSADPFVKGKLSPGVAVAVYQSKDDGCHSLGFSCCAILTSSFSSPSS